MTPEQQIAALEAQVRDLTAQVELQQKFTTQAETLYLAAKERLAAQAETVSQLRQDYGQCQVYLVEAKAEIARLREALRTYGHKEKDEEKKVARVDGQ